MLAFLAFVIAVIALVQARNYKARVDELERRASEQYDLIRGLSIELDQLRKDFEAAPAPKPAAPKPAEPKPVEKLVEEKPAALRVTPPIITTPAPPPLPPPKPIVAPPPPPPVIEPAAQSDFDRELEEQALAAKHVDAVDEEVEAPNEPPSAPPLEPPLEPPSEPPFAIDWESFVGVKLFSAIAGISLVFGAIFFLRYSIEAGWLQPPVRVVIGVIVGIALLVVCDLKAARKYPLLANAMDAAAIAILFATFFAAHSLWDLIPAPMTFGLLALVTFTAVLLSIRHESLFIAVLGLLGGFATPILLSTGENQPIPLFAYLLLLNIGLAWVAYRKGWAILSTLTLFFTAIYQFGWVGRFLDEGQLPLAVGIFTVFPVVSFGMLAISRRRAAMREHGEGVERTFEWTTLASSTVPAIFAVYFASASQFKEHYLLLFGWLFLIDCGLLAIAIARRQELVHAFGGGTTLLVFLVWLWNSYMPGSTMTIMGLVALFVALYLAAPTLAARFGDEFEDAGLTATLTAPILLFVFPLLAGAEPQASSPWLLFLPLFILVAIISWRSIALQSGTLYFIAAFFALATEAAWSAKYLSPETFWPAVATYVVFAALYLGVPQIARRRGEPLEPEWGAGVVMLASLAMLIFIASGPVAVSGLWGFAFLLAILNASLFIESASTGLPLLSIAASLLSWFVLLGWWIRAASSVGLRSSLLVAVGFSLFQAGGYLWALQRSIAAGAESPRGFRQGVWLSLLVHGFLIAIALNADRAIPPWPLFGSLFVVTLAISAVGLGAARPAMHFASTVATTLVLILWAQTTQPRGYAPVAIAAYGALTLYALIWIWMMKRHAGMSPRILAPAGTAATVLVLVEFAISAMNANALPASFWLTIGAHVVGFVILLALAARHEWAWAATGFAVLAGNAAGQMMLRQGHTGGETLLQVSLLFAPFALYPLALGSRARESRDPYIAALIGSVWCFFIARQGMIELDREWMVGVVPVALGAIITVHLRQLLRIQPSGERDLGRLALVAGAALAFLTVTIPLQLEERWITIGWALEGAAVAWLYTRIPHRGLMYTAAGLMVTVFVRLALNPEVFRYEPRGELRIINWYLYTYLIVSAAMGLAAYWLSKTDDEIVPGMPRLRLRAILPVGAVILLFLLLNIEIADYYSDGPEILFRFGASIQQDLTYTIAWLVFGIVMLIAGIIWKSRSARAASVAMIAVTTLKAFLYDLRSLEGLYRVGAFVGLAISLALVSLILQKYVLKVDKEKA